MIARSVILAVLVAALFGSLLSLVAARHEARTQFIEQQQLLDAQAALDLEWTQLQVELAVWAAPSRVERKAVDELNMSRPDMNETVFIEVPRWAR